MTDFFADLERELRAAHARDDRGWRPALRSVLPRRVTVVRFAMASAASVAVIALVTLVLANSTGDPEREVAAPGVGGERPQCTLPDPPQELTSQYEVLRRPVTPSDRLPTHILRSVDTDQPEHGRPARIWTADARLARATSGTLWLVPVLFGQPCDEAPVEADRQAGLCAVHESEDGLLTRCFVGDELRSGGPIFSGPDPDLGWSHAALVPDDRRAMLTVRGERVRGSTEGNVYFVSYHGSPADHQSAELTIVDRARQNLHSPDTAPVEGWTAYGPGCSGSGPETAVDRLAVLRRPPDPPTDFVLGNPDVVNSYGDAARFVRFGNGLEALVVPVDIGSCEPRDLDPGVCLIPSDRDWDTDCRALPPSEAEPFVFALLHDSGDEVEVAAVVNDVVGRVAVNDLEVEVEAGTVTATVRASEPSGVTIRPVG